MIDIDDRQYLCKIEALQRERTTHEGFDHDLVGVAEVVELLGISRQRVNILMRTHEHFPEPVAELKAGRIWFRKDIVKWALQVGRLPRPLKMTPEKRSSSERRSK